MWFDVQFQICFTVYCRRFVALWTLPHRKVVLANEEYIEGSWNWEKELGRCDFAIFIYFIGKIFVQNASIMRLRKSPSHQSLKIDQCIFRDMYLSCFSLWFWILLWGGGLVRKILLAKKESVFRPSAFVCWERGSVWRSWKFNAGLQVHEVQTNSVSCLCPEITSLLKN